MRTALRTLAGRWPSTALALVVAVLLAAPSLARADDVATAGRVVSLRGVATVVRGPQGGTYREPLARGDYLHEGDEIDTGNATAVRVLMNDDSVLDIGANSRFTIEHFHLNAKAHKRSVGLRLWVGRLWAHVTHFVDAHTNFEVDTPNAVAGVRGTEFIVQVDAKGHTTITVINGAVEIHLAHGALRKLLQALQQARTARGHWLLHQVTEAEIERLLEAIRPGPQLEPNNPLPGTNGLLHPGSGGSKQTKPPKSVPGSSNGLLPPVPPLEPGSGSVKIKGRIQIQAK